MIKKIKVIGSRYDYSTIQVGVENDKYYTLDSAGGKSRIEWYNSKFVNLDSLVLDNLTLGMFKGFNKAVWFLDISRTTIYTICDFKLVELNEFRKLDRKYSVERNAITELYVRGSKKINGRLEYAIINLEDVSLVASSALAPYFYGEIIVNIKDLKLQRLEEKTLEPIWSKDYTTELDHIEGMNRVMAPIIGVHSDVFVFSYQGKWLVGVDVQTGEISWKVSGNWSKSQILENGNIFVMVGSQMRLLDIKTGELIGEYGEVEGEIGPQRMNYTFIGDHVILTGRPSDTIGAYNTKTYKYDWIYKEEGTQWSPQPMKYYHPYLFVNDTKGNLHVFKVDDEMNLK